MQSPLYSSPAIHLTPTDCVDVHADSDAIVAGFICKSGAFSIHFKSAEQVIEFAEYLTEGATKFLAAREG